MGGVESIGGAGYISHMPRVTATTAANEQSPAVPNNSPKRSAGLAGALEMSDSFLRQIMSEVGFVDMQASSLEKLKVSLRLGRPKEKPSEATLDLVSASELAHMGGETTQYVDQVLRILAQIDPERVAALLK